MTYSLTYEVLFYTIVGASEGMKKFISFIKNEECENFQIKANRSKNIINFSVRSFDADKFGDKHDSVLNFIKKLKDVRLIYNHLPILNMEIRHFWSVEKV